MALQSSIILLVIMMISTPTLVHAQGDREVEVSNVHSTQSLLNDLKIPEFSTFGFLLTYFPSQFIHNGIALKSYVRSKRFQYMRKQFGDLRAVDALYIRALRLTEGNTAMALLYCTIATMDHRIVGLKIPILRLYFPLTDESAEEFARRINNLPSHFYPDSPKHSAGDRDKLQHFFGSASMANIFESRSAAERTGNFIEWGEDAFIIDGVYDDRDMRANRQGSEFGLALLNASANERQLLPSDFLKVHIATFCGAW